MILTDEECRDTYNAAMALPDRSIVCATRHIEAAVLAKLAAREQTAPKAMTAQEVRSDIGIHLAHCFQPPYDTSCKYGDDDCPATPKAAQATAKPVTKFKLLTITTAYEQGVGKGIKRNDFNPYVEGIVEWDAWRLGYEEGLTKTAVADLPEPVVLRSTGGHLQGVNDDMDAEVIARYVACGWTPLYTSPPDHTAAMRLALEALRLPCNYWNKRQFEIINTAIAALEEELK